MSETCFIQQNRLSKACIWQIKRKYSDRYLRKYNKSIENTIQVPIFGPKQKNIQNKFNTYITITGKSISTQKSKAGPLRACVAFFKIRKSTKALGVGELL